MVGGQRDVAYSDLDAGLQRATEEGQQIVAPVEEEPVRPLTVVVNDEDEFRRPAGKLYGVSLIDAIESRKANMRSRQRFVRSFIFINTSPIRTHLLTGDRIGYSRVTIVLQ